MVKMVDIPLVPGSIYHGYGGRNTMGSGRYTMGRGVKIPWVRGFNIYYGVIKLKKIEIFKKVQNFKKIIKFPKKSKLK